MKLSLIVVSTLLIACGSESEPQPEKLPPVIDSGINKPYAPPVTPVRVKECVVTKTTIIEDCKLYDLFCDDGDTDMVLLCPIRYWVPGEYIPTPP
jgi:hypothetical protein